MTKPVGKKKKKKVYTTLVVEQPVDAPRERAWESVLAVAGAEPFVSHAQLAVEPPWRWVYKVNDQHMAFHEGTITIRDDGAACHMSWSLLLDPHPGRSAEETDTYLAERRAELVERCAAIAAASV